MALVQVLVILLRTRNVANSTKCNCISTERVPYNAYVIQERNVRTHLGNLFTISLQAWRSWVVFRWPYPSTSGINPGSYIFKDDTGRHIGV